MLSIAYMSDGTVLTLRSTFSKILFEHCKSQNTIVHLQLVESFLSPHLLYLYFTQFNFIKQEFRLFDVRMNQKNVSRIPILRF